MIIHIRAAGKGTSSLQVQWVTRWMTEVSLPYTQFITRKLVTNANHPKLIYANQKIWGWSLQWSVFQLAFQVFLMQLKFRLWLPTRVNLAFKEYWGLGISKRFYNELMIIVCNQAWESVPAWKVLNLCCIFLRVPWLLHISNHHYSTLIICKLLL